MKIAIALLILLACAQSSLAAGSACHTIESESKRLTCYDAAFPPTVRKPQAVKMDASQSSYKDPFTEEEARTNAKLKGICRGC